MINRNIDLLNEKCEYSQNVLQLFNHEFVE